MTTPQAALLEVYAQTDIMGVTWDLLHPQMKPHMLGYIPSWIYPEAQGPLKDALARCQGGDETLVFYQHSWVAIIQQDWSFEVCRMD